MEIYQRRFEIELQVNNGQSLTWSSDNSSDVLRVDFSIRKTMGGIGEQGDITVTGLSLENIQYICTVMRPPAGKELPKNYICLKAGYGDDYGVIFEGGIFKAIPSLDTPDLSVKLECVPGFQNSQSKPFKYSGKNVAFAEVARKLATNLGTPLKLNSSKAEEVTIKSCSFDCTGLQAIRQLRGYLPNGVNIYMTGGILYVTDSNAKAVDIIKLAGDSGLIGTPEPTIAGMNCKTLLRPSLEAGGFVNVESVKLPDINGNYRIINLTHSGSSRGDEFYSTIEGKRV